MIVTPGTVILEWDAVSAEPGESVEYNLYILRMYADPGNKIRVGESMNTQEAITFTEEGTWIVGVSSVRVMADGTTRIENPDISWSDDVTRVQDGQTFAVQYYELLPPPQNLRVQ
jgi:archaellum component FlaF (FlaF/FlaG flagellin family)